MQLKEDDIDVCHRVGAPNPSKPRQVIVRFLRRQTKDRLFVQKKHLKPQGLMLFHDLTHANNRLLYDVKHHNRVQSAWVSYTGKILAKDAQGHTIHVDMKSDIDSLFNKFTNK